MTSYPYERLPQGRWTRLLRLMPSPKEFTQIECQIIRKFLDDKEELQFEALSYCWGDTTITRAILVNGYTFHATLNLFQALESLRRPDVPRLLWVDAVCINQKDLVEQGAQVAMMWHIYAAASSVIVWLGPLDRDSAVAMRNISAGAAQAKMLARQKWDREGKTCKCHAGDGRTHPDRVGILKLIRREWFTRAWVLQEVCAAKRVVVACGSMTVNGEQFYREITSVAFFYPSMDRILRKIRPALEFMNRSEHDVRSEGKRLSVIQLIESFKTWKATMPIDRVYALLGMSSDAHLSSDLQPDYTISLENLSKKLIKFSFPTASVTSTYSPGIPGEVLFAVEGLILGQLGGKCRGPGARAWSIHSGRSDLAGVVFNPKVLHLQDKWMICMTNERKLKEGSAVVLLRGATQPTILQKDGNHYKVDMLATTEPIYGFPWFRKSHNEGSWSEILQTLAHETEGLMHFNLIWNPFRAPSPSELSRFALHPNDLTIQWEAMLETVKDAADQGDYQYDNHDCNTITRLWVTYQHEKHALKSGSSQHTITLHHAAYRNAPGTLKLLLDSGAPVNALHPTLHRTALHIAAHEGNLTIVRELLYAGADLSIPDPTGRPALHLAISAQHTPIVKLLLYFGASPIPALNIARTYLIGPAVFGLTEMMTALLDAGADPNATDEIPGMQGIAPLHMAAENGHVEIMEALLDAGVDTDVRNSLGATPLVQAAMNGWVEGVRLLLERGADVNTKQENGATARDVAVYKEQWKVVEVLEEAGGARNLIFEEESVSGWR